MTGEVSGQGRIEPQASPPQAPPQYPFPDSAQGLLPWSYAAERLQRARNYWLATTRPDGRPHVTPVWGVWVGEALYFDGLPTAQWARNIAANTAVSVHLESGEEVVILEGAVEDLRTGADLAARIVEAWDVKYGSLLPDPGGSGLFRLRPRTGRAWSSSSLEDGTRWHFADVDP